MPRLRHLVPLLALLAFAAACGGSGGTAATAEPTPAEEVRLGYFANVTHAAGDRRRRAGPLRRGARATRARRPTFNAGPDAVEALFAGALDVSYIGPNPAINAFAQSDGEAIRIIAGATSGGAALVVQPTVTTPAQTRGQEARDARSSATRRTSRCAPGWTSRAQRDLEGGGDVTIAAAGERADARDRSARRDRRRLGAGAVGDAARRSRAAARCWSTSATCGRTASS